MKNAIVAVAMALSHLAAFACEPIGWRLVQQKQISVTERLCVWEKNQVRVSKIVDGLCPLDPC